MDWVHHILHRARGLPLTVQVGAIALLACVVYYIVLGDRPYKGIPIVALEPKEQGLRRLLPGQPAWATESKRLLNKGLAECTGCFQVKTGVGYKIIVPNRFADELRNHHHLNFNEAFNRELFVDYPGFEGPRAGLKDDTLIQEVVRVKLTQSLGLITDDLVDEMNQASEDIWGEVAQWTTRRIKDDVLQLVARLSSRVFLGKDLCRNEQWLDITKNYTVDVFMGAQLLKILPAPLRPVLHWFIPQCTRLRQQVAAANQLIAPEVEKRVQRAARIIADGGKAPKAADAVGWAVEVARERRVDHVALQLSLSLAAIHTTTETATRCLLQLCRTPEIVEPLRREVVEVLRADGWAKTTLYKLKLMDSFLKEVQRTEGMALVSMARRVQKATPLSDGTTLPAGGYILIPDDRVADPELYDEPATFDVGRFLRMRQRPGEENKHQFVTTSGDHLGFGHGQHACPGRFFASNELKVALCFWLLKYDFKSAGGDPGSDFVQFETAKSVNPNLQMQIRRREPEIDPVQPQA